MYYIKSLMKNTIFKLTEYVYYFSLLVLLILYFFPGSLIGYLLYGNLIKQPNLIASPIGTSINHLIFFSYITILLITVRLRAKNILTDYRFILFISCVLEILHLIVPNRAFELYDLLANFTGVVIIISINSFIKWQKHL